MDSFPCQISTCCNQYFLARCSGQNFTVKSWSDTIGIPTAQYTTNLERTWQGTTSDGKNADCQFKLTTDGVLVKSELRQTGEITKQRWIVTSEGSFSMELLYSKDGSDSWFKCTQKYQLCTKEDNC